jgi:hypothetical protein
VTQNAFGELAGFAARLDPERANACLACSSGSGPATVTISALCAARPASRALPGSTSTWYTAMSRSGDGGSCVIVASRPPSLTAA